MNREDRIRAESARLRDELAELEKSIPAHGLKPDHLRRIEELEERIEELESEMD